MIVDPKLDQALARHLGRVLIVDSTSTSARMLSELLQGIRRGEIWIATSTGAALSMAQTTDPQTIFTEYAGPELDGLGFTRALRRSTLSCRKAPVIMITAQATPAAILGARDVGVHEFLRKPYTIKDLVRRIKAAVLRPRVWVEAVGYIGPDRRRFNSAEFKGARKRHNDAAQDTDQERAVQALRIVASAVKAVESDPQQAFRSLLTQAADLRAFAAAILNIEMGSAAAELEVYLKQIGSGDHLDRIGLEPRVQKLLAFLPKEDSGRARSAA